MDTPIVKNTIAQEIKLVFRYRQFIFALWLHNRYCLVIVSLQASPGLLSKKILHFRYMYSGQ